MQQVIQWHHNNEDCSHPGRDETIRKIQQIYYWKSMAHQVGLYIKRCLTCAAVKTRQIQQEAPMQAHRPTGPFETTSIDILGPYPLTPRQNRYMIIVEDTFTKWVEAKPFHKVDINIILRYLEEEIISRYGTPRKIISDHGITFQSNAYLRYCARNHIEILYSAVEHQKANPVERRVQEFKKVLRSLMHEQRDETWDLYIQKALYVLRTRRNAATAETPSKALLGYELPLPTHWEIPLYDRERRRARHIPAAEIRNRQIEYQTRKYARPDQIPKVTFRPGDRVLTRKPISTKKQFGPSWTGPYVINRKISNEIYELDREGHMITLHVDQLRPVPPGNEPAQDSDSDSDHDPGPERE
ncbi:hypothetical protein NQ314_012162 [Rhamnusium bicolor]|uniref:RNA-directed DNA polymerase n=1 Tax=Rhamnusium bicolor TaxID=1586634 RepID=A0AAV8XEF0_9CUCU|nr:hypothetical protein NQ314_012162 [Rhamnusium bicolor]